MSNFIGETSAIKDTSINIKNTISINISGLHPTDIAGLNHFIKEVVNATGVNIVPTNSAADINFSYTNVFTISEAHRASHPDAPDTINSADPTIAGYDLRNGGWEAGTKTLFLPPNQQGNFGWGMQNYSLLAHELLHAFGLKHAVPQAENDVGPYLSTPSLNRSEYTLMAYAQPNVASPPKTLLGALDIAALQEMYGARISGQNQVLLIDGAYSGAIWGGGSADLIDGSLASTNSIIDLRQGEFSSIGPSALGDPASHNIGVAYGATIENAKGGAGDDTIIGNYLANTLWGGAGKDVIWGDTNKRDPQNKATLSAGKYQVDEGCLEFGDDTLFGGDGNDTLVGGGGNDTLFGGSGSTKLIDKSDGTDVADYSISQFVRASVSGNGKTLTVTDDQGTDSLYSIEKIIGVAGASTFSGDRPAGLQLSNFKEASYRKTTENLRVTGSNDLISISAGGDESDVFFGHLDTLITGSGDDTVQSAALGLTLDTGAGDDTILQAGYGSVITTGAGSDTIALGNNVLVTDAGFIDKLVYGGKVLHGALRNTLSESAWALDGNMVRYGINTLGDLVVRDSANRTTFLANYTGGPGSGGNNTAGIFLAEVSLKVYRLLDAPMSGVDSIKKQFEYGAAKIKAMTGKNMFGGVDPLVLDLGGQGIDLTPQSQVAPLFDMNGTGFAVRTGWVGGDTALLALDANGNGKIDDIGELFGSASQSGFDELALLDSNTDGVIDASDTAFSQLTVWRDADGDAQTDAGELQSLSEAGVSSLSLTATSQLHVFSQGNQVTELGSFTRADGGTGAMNDVWFRVDNFRTTYLGDTQVSADAAARAQLKGYGTLCDLRIAMTQDPTLVATMDTLLPTLTAIDLPSLRMAALPILTAWAKAVKLPEADGQLHEVDPASHADVPILVNADGALTDFAWQESNGDWRLSSHASVLDAQGNVIAHPTLAQVMAQPGWTTFPGEALGFLERYYGETISVDGGDVSTAGGLLGSCWSTLNQLSVRLAAQGPLAAYFDGIAYDAVADKFRPTGDRQLTPMFDAIFEAAPETGAGALAWLTQWRQILDTVISDFDRGADYLKVSYGYLFSNIVAAYEDVGLATDIKSAAAALGVPEDLILAGGAVLTGGDDADILYLGNGETLAKGGAGPDTYVVGRNFTHAVVDELEEAGQPNHADMLRLSHTRSTDVTAVRDGIDLILTDSTTGGDVRVVGQFRGIIPSLSGGNIGPESGVAEIIFADGVVWDQLDMAEAVSHPLASDDTLIGTAATDVMAGGAGDDILRGGDSGDIYRFGRGDGHDVIDEWQNYVLNDAPDIVQFGAGISLSDLSLSRVGTSDDLLISVDGGESLLVSGQFTASFTIVVGTLWTKRVENFIFADGSDIGWEQVIDSIISASQTAGNDVVQGFSSDDTLEGGTGDDSLLGGNGADTYVFRKGDGHDVIYDASNAIAGMDGDRIVFGEGIRPEDVTVSQTNEQDIVLTIGDGSDSIRLQQPYGILGINMNEIETLSFADGTVWGRNDILTRAVVGTAGNDVIRGFYWDDTLDGGAGNDILAGSDGKNVYVFGQGYGHDTIQTGWWYLLADHDNRIRLNPGITPDMLRLWRNGGDVTLGIDGSDDRITIQGQYGYTGTAHEGSITHVEFADGSLWDMAAIEAAIGPALRAAPGDTVLNGTINSDTLIGSSGVETLVGSGGNDTFIGGAGDQTLVGGAGNDTYLFAAGDGRKVITDAGGQNSLILGAGIAAGSVGLSVVVDDLVVTSGIDGDSITVTDWRWVPRFSDVTLADGTILSLSGPLTYVGSSGNDNLNALKSGDTLDGSLGNDTLFAAGNGATNTFLYGRGYGDTQIFANRSNNGVGSVIRMKAGISLADLALRSDGFTLDIAVAGAGTLSVINQSYFQKVTDLIFADGTSLSLNGPLSYMGSSGNDSLTAVVSGDTLDGGLGNDSLHAAGNGGTNTFLYGSGYGDLLIDANDSSSGTGSVLRMKAGISTTDVTFRTTGIDLQIAVAGAGTITVSYQQVYRKLTRVEFADGGVIDLTAPLTYTGTSGNDTLTASMGGDTIDGGLGYDTLAAADGNGANTFLYGLGYGDTVVLANAASNGTGSRISMKTGLTVADVAFRINGNDMIAVINGAGTITVKDQRLYHKLTDMDFADGGTLNLNGALTYLGTDGNDTMNTSLSGDTLVGGLGDDTYVGLSGGVTNILYGLGDGNDLVDVNLSSAATGSKIHMKAGITLADLGFKISGSDLLIMVGGAGIITVRNQQIYHRVTEIDFADGGTLNLNGPLTYVGTSGNDILTASMSGDTLDGGLGNDTLRGVSGGATNILYGLGYGNALIEVNHPIYATGSKIWMKAGLTAADVSFRNSSSNLLAVVNGAGTITIQFQQLYHRVSSINFTDGSSINLNGPLTYSGTSGNDTLTASMSGDTLDGGLGNDTLRGMSGGTTNILYGLGYGNALVDVNYSSYGTGSKIWMKEGISAADVGFRISGSNLLAVVNGAGTITIQLQQMYHKVTDMVFADGSSINLNGSLTYVGTSGNDTLTATVNGDTLKGEAGNDSLVSGSGHDTLVGGSGADTYAFARGGSVDVIDNTGGASDGDKVLFGSGIAKDQLWFQQTADDLKVSIIGTNDNITLAGWFADTANHVSTLKLYDGKILADTAVQNLVSAMASLTPPPLGQTTLTTAEHQQLDTVIAANWH